MGGGGAMVFVDLSLGPGGGRRGGAEPAGGGGGG